MEYKEISDLVKLVSKSNLAELKVKDGDFEISIRTSYYAKDKSASSKTELPQIVNVSAPAPQPTSPPPAVVASPPAPATAETPPAAAAAAETKGDYLEIRSPMVGTFYRSPSPEKGPYIKVGDTIEQGSVVCIIEAMKLFNEIESEISGKIAKVVVEDATPVEYDQVLFLLEPA